ncbi:hypothetical protein WKH82_17960 [Acinetobacter baumannii]
MKLRLTGSGFQNYTGQMGIHYFENGISVHDVLPVDGMRIAGTIGAEWVDGTPANVGEIYASSLQVEAPTSLQLGRVDPLAQVVGIADATKVIAHTQSVAELQFKATGTEVPESVKAEKVAVIANESDTEASTASTKYTREQLEAIVDDKGFAGLREIGAAVGVKAGSINALIEEILAVAGEQA